MISISVPPITIEIVSGDIAGQAVDAIVNAANTHFWMGAGVAGAIKALGGPEIEADAVRQGPVDPGQCVVTAGGKRLPARFVIHAAVMGQDLQTSSAFIEAATRNALKAADELKLTSVAFPALGTGVGGFPVRDCARIMIEAARDWARRTASVRLVRFVLFGQDSYRDFADVADSIER